MQDRARSNVDADVVVVGAGIVGLATAYRLLDDHPQLKVTVVDKEEVVGAHQSSHNSGVIHAGVYYRPGSHKARLCRQGKEQLERFADEHGVARTTPGKLVVATDGGELDRFDDLAARAHANEVPGLVEIDAAQLAEQEPNVAGVRALWSPTTGSIDFGEVCVALAGKVRAGGGVIMTSTEVVDLQERDEAVVVTTTAGDLKAQVVVTCAGLQADRVAAMTASSSAPSIVAFRGAWLRLSSAASQLVSTHVYPVPDPRFPFLGVHLSPRVDGQVWIGPNAVLAAGREAYDGRMDWQDVGDMATTAALWRLAARYWRQGAVEVFRDRIRSAYLREVRRYLPQLQDEDVLDDRAVGIRAQALAPDGRLVDDFVFDDTARIVHVRNAPSPAATASLAIGRVIANRAVERLELD